MFPVGVSTYRQVVVLSNFSKFLSICFFPQPTCGLPPPGSLFTFFQLANFNAITVCCWRGRRRRRRRRRRWKGFEQISVWGFKPGSECAESAECILNLSFEVALWRVCGLVFRLVDIGEKPEAGWLWSSQAYAMSQGTYYSRLIYLPQIILHRKIGFVLKISIAMV